MLRKVMLTTAAATLAAAPVAAQAAPVRSSSPVAEGEQLKGGLLPIIAAVAFSLLLILLIDSEDEPTSP
jgi:hypothetical protein